MTMTMSICTLACVLLLAVHRACALDAAPAAENADLDDPSPLDPAALLQRALGIRKPAVANTPQYQVLHHSTPRFMQELYDAVADDHGYTRAATPYNADVVWGMMNLDTSAGNTFWFNVSTLLENNGRVLDAELHLFRIKPRLNRANRLLSTMQTLQIRVYEILSKPANVRTLLTQVNNAAALKLITSKTVQADTVGWEVLRVTTAVQDWVSGSANLGLYVVAYGQGQNAPLDNQNVLKFLQAHEEKQPCLVVFSSSEQPAEPGEETEADTGREFNMLRDSYTPENDRRLQQLYDHEFSERIRMLNQPIYDAEDGMDESTSEPSLMPSGAAASSDNARWKRAASPRRGRVRPKPCKLEKMYVNFTLLGWDKWIISPKAYDAHVCRGECTYPIGHHMNATNHAIVQSLLAATRRSGVPPPCCVPGETKSLSLLYYEDTSVVLRRYDEMIAHSCVCR